MSEREERIINAMLEAVWNGDWLKRYAILSLEDKTRYDLSDAAKKYFYDHVDHPNEV